jgi:acylphosphatase
MKATIIVQGIVQGVGYRFFAVEIAKQYNIKGYARNLPDGNVEVIAEGDEGMLNEFIKRLKIGPGSARVTGIDVKWDDTDFGFDSFDIRF